MMKKLVNLMSVVLLIACSITFFSCNPKEELTEGEKSFVGTWILSDDITYWEANNTYWEPGQTWIKNEIRYHYPSSASDSFNSFCEKYIGKVSLVLDGTKKDGKMSAVLSMNGEETTLKWYGNKRSDAIKFSPSLPIPDYSLSNSHGRTQTALMSKNRLFVVSDFKKSTLMYFDKCD